MTELPKGFLETEEREGFLVPARMKAAWAVMLDILERFDGICRRHGLRYGVVAGTLLGAIRHRGFIPWDDDVDVAMPREDYDRFLKIAQAELPANYFLQTSVTDPEHLFGFAKIRRLDTAAIFPPNVERRSRICQGMFIDVMPIDGCPEEAKERERVLRSTRFWKRLQFAAVSYVQATWLQGAGAWIARQLVRLLRPRSLNWLRERILRRCVRRPGGKCVIGPTEFGYKRMYPSEVFDEFVDAPFEYLTVKVPKGYETYLQVAFGDWRVPVRGSGYHSGLDLRADKDYKTVLCEDYGYTREMFRKVRIRGARILYEN